MDESPLKKHTIERHLSTFGRNQKRLTRFTSQLSVMIFIFLSSSSSVSIPLFFAALDWIVQLEFRTVCSIKELMEKWGSQSKNNFIHLSFCARHNNTFRRVLPTRRKKMIFCVCWQFLPILSLLCEFKGKQWGYWVLVRGHQIRQFAVWLESYLHQGYKERLFLVALQQLVDDLTLLHRENLT